jgi:bifunctional DNase/RNase
MIRVNVDSIRVSLLTQHRVIVLREIDSRRYLPIWIGPFEAEAIATAIQGHEPVRPMTHDLLKSVITELGGTINHIVVNDIQDQTFYARIVIDVQGSQIDIDARPSDAIALAVRCDIPIFVDSHVIDQVGVYFDDDDQTLADQSSLDATSSLPTPPSSAAQAFRQPPMTPEPDEPSSEPDMNDEDLTLFRNFINTLDRKKSKSDEEDEA